MYKHSFGHHRTQADAFAAKIELEQEYDIVLEVVKEKRKNSRWAKWCICQFFPFKKSRKTNRKK